MVCGVCSSEDCWLFTICQAQYWVSEFSNLTALLLTLWLAVLLIRYQRTLQRRPVTVCMGVGCGGTLPDAEAVDSRLLGNHCYNQVEMLKGGCYLSEFGIMEREREEKRSDVDSKMVKSEMRRKLCKILNFPLQLRFS